MERLILALVLIFGSASWPAYAQLDQSSAGQLPLTQRLVFAHYMLGYCPNGVVSVGSPVCTLAGMKEDIQQAQASGVDGFGLDFGAYSQQPYYKTNMATMYAAANALGTGFKLFLIPDGPGSSGLPLADVLSAAETYCPNPAQLTYNGKCVLSAWAADQNWSPSYWQTNVLTPLANAGDPVAFLPQINNLDAVPTSSEVATVESTWNSVVAGYYYFGVSGVPTYADRPSLLDGGEAWASVTHSNNKIYMAPVSCQYWNAINTSGGRRYFEYGGGQGFANQWASIINIQQPQWIMDVTWDDYNESYTTPAEPSVIYRPWVDTPHAGCAALMGYYARWYKSGTQPPITKDALYYFYRTSPRAAIASHDPLGAITQFYGNVLDDIYITTFLTAPATLTVNSGGSISNHNLGADITNTVVTFTVGSTQAFTLTRNGHTLISLTGQPIVATPVSYNFMYSTGYAHD
jgi:glucan endo-1,3-alpha-glucosidase